MAKDKSARTISTPADAADPRFVPVIKALARTPGFSLMESKSGAMRGLMLNGKSFGMSSHGRLILKLTEERAAALIARGIGKPFRPSAGRVMKGWIEVTHRKADWVALAKEARQIAVAQKGAQASKAKPKPEVKAKAKRRASAVASPSAGGGAPGIDEYLAEIDGEQRAALEKLRRTIRSLVPEAEECISYRMPAFRLGGKVIAGFAARAKGCSYFPFSGTTLGTLAGNLAGYEGTKSALHFDAATGLPKPLVRKLLEARIAE